MQARKIILLITLIVLLIIGIFLMANILVQNNSQESRCYGLSKTLCGDDPQCEYGSIYDSAFNDVRHGCKPISK